jgi:hypothetical protein
VKSTGFVLVTNASGLRRDLAAAGLAANLVFDRTIDAGHNNIYDHASLVAAMRLPHDRVLVKRVEAEEKTKGGIIIPDTAQEKPQEADVIAVGSGARDESGKLIPIDSQGRRPHSARQVVWDGDQDRWRGPPHLEGERRHGRGGETCRPGAPEGLRWP